jgi:hypothetical protein
MVYSWACRENLFRCRRDGHLRHLKPVINDYDRDAYKIFFPAPRVLAPEAKNEGRGFLLMVFETAGLARSETKAAASLSGMPRQSRIPEAARPGGGARHTVDAARRSR